MKADGRSSADAGTLQSASPAFQIIILGAGGGPNEDNVTGLLVKSTATQWTRDSVLAVDAGVHLAAIIKIFEEHLPQASLRTTTVVSAAAIPVNGDNPSTPAESAKPKLFMATGPFANLELPHETAKANATYVFRSLISTYLITHPHLDHIAGFAINTAALQQTLRRKRVAALPSTIEAIKEHIFNGVIWPNLSDEGDGAVGFVSYDRLVDGGNVALGDGEGRGYIEVCDGLAVKGWSVSHGECMRHSHHQGSYSSESTEAGYSPYFSRRASRKDMSSGSMESARSQSFSQVSSEKKAYDSAAYFLRDEHTGKEVLIFGDVEPDSVSLNPRTARVWQDAAAKLSAGSLTGVVIECSYDDSQPDGMLFGHLTPRHLVIELGVLASKVRALAAPDGRPGSPRKRKRPSNGHKLPSDELQSRRPPSRHHVRRRTRSSVSPSTPLRPESPRHSSAEMILTNEDTELGSIVEEDGTSHKKSKSQATATAKPLEGLKVIIIHVKDPLRDGPSIQDTILAQLQEHERELQLGCTFIVSQSGTSLWL
ncbi:MAG: hypothetical protein Q9169_005315 [Polycauliona sp. 2 TL-2023]